MSQTCLTCPRGMKTKDGVMGNTHAIQPHLCPTQTHVNPPASQGRERAWSLGYFGGGVHLQGLWHLEVPNTISLLPSSLSKREQANCCQNLAMLLTSVPTLSRPNAPLLGTDGDQSLGGFSPSSRQPKRKSHKQQERRQITHQGTTSG